MCSTCKNKPLTTKEQNLEFKQVKRGMKYSFILQTDVLGSETVEKTVSIRKYFVFKNWLLYVCDSFG